MMNCLRLSCVALAVLVMGCSSSVDPNRPKTYKVKGVVNYKGQPVEGATVMFVGTGGQERGAVGKTDASGTFQLTTFDAGDGALPGPYKVSVTKTVLEDVPEEIGPGGPSGEEPFSGTAKDHLPTKYKDANKSGLTADVKESDDNSITFDLVD